MNTVSIYLTPESVPKGIRDPKKAVKINDKCEIVRIPKGTVEGKSSIAIVCDLPGGKYLFLEMTMQNFLMVASMFNAAERQDQVSTN